MAQLPARSPFDDFRDLALIVPDPDEQALKAANERLADTSIQPGSLGRLAELYTWLASWQAKPEPMAENVLLALFASTHGIADQHPTTTGSADAHKMLTAITKSGAGVNQICASQNLGLRVFELAVEIPTQDVTNAPAFAENDCAATIAFGMEAIAAGADILCLGEIGAGSQEAAAILAHALFGKSPQDWLLKGEGESDESFAARTALVAKPREKHAMAMDDALDVLRICGGRDTAALFGAILAARMQRVPVILDGYMATIAAAMLASINPRAIDHCLIAQKPVNPGHAMLVKMLGKEPLVDLGLADSIGGGAAMATAALRAAIQAYGQSWSREQLDAIMPSKTH